MKDPICIHSLILADAVLLPNNNESIFDDVSPAKTQLDMKLTDNNK